MPSASEIRQEFALQKPQNENHKNGKPRHAMRHIDDKKNNDYNDNIEDENEIENVDGEEDENYHKMVNREENENENEKEKYDEYEDEYQDFLKSAADALNNTKKAQIQDVVVFNRVPKVGSQSLMGLMLALGKVNNFINSRDIGKARETILLKANQQKQLIDEIYQKPRPHVYSQHLAYINFTRFHMPKPIYINLVRDPVERIISWHYYIRAEWYYKDMKLKLGDQAPNRPSDEFMNMDFDTCLQKRNLYCRFDQMETKNPTADHRRQTLFFCGQNRQLCMPFNSQAAMQKAKHTVEQEYAVVGTWEDPNITLSVFEHYIPRFFRNAKTVYHLSKERLSSVNQNKSKRPVSELSKQILRQNLTHEIEFYEFCKQRLYMQYAAINGDKVDNDDYAIIPDHEEDDNF